MAGMIHVPTADMDTVGVARVGAHYIPKSMMPDKMTLDGEKFNSWTNYLSITPFRWIELGYGYTLWKMHKNQNKNEKTGFYSKDRYFSVRLRPLSEGRYWPSVVIGGNDVIGQRDGDSYSFYFRNFYVAASKHIDLPFGEVGGHLAYRKWAKSFNNRWDGVVGGVTLRPSVYRPLRAIAEYDGESVNIGADCVLFRYVQLQASLMHCRYLSAGAAVRIELK
jgi:hypothetical protein